MDKPSVVLSKANPSPQGHLPSKSTSFSLTTSDFPSLLFPINIQSYYYFSYFWRKTLGPSFPSSYHPISLLPFLKKKKKKKPLENILVLIVSSSLLSPLQSGFGLFEGLGTISPVTSVLQNHCLFLLEFIAFSSWKYSLITHHNLWVFLLPHYLLLLSLLVLQLVHLYFGALQGTLSLLFL